MAWTPPITHTCVQILMHTMIINEEHKIPIPGPPWVHPKLFITYNLYEQYFNYISSIMVMLLRSEYPCAYMKLSVNTDDQLEPVIY